jgi:hypothetical protein
MNKQILKYLEDIEIPNIPPHEYLERWLPDFIKRVELIKKLEEEFKNEKKE